MRKKSMKLLIIHEIFYPEFSGGAEKILLEIASRLRKEHKIVLITSGNPSIKYFNKIRTVRVPVHRMLLNIFALPYILAYGKKFDVLIGNTYHSALPVAIASLLLKKPAICIVHGAYGKKWLEMKGFMGLAAILFEKIIFKLPFSRFVFFSNFALHSAMKLGVNRKKCITIPPGIDIKKFKRRKKERFVLFVGRLEKQKGIDMVIKVAKILPSVKFIIVGKMREKINEFPKNVQWRGFISEKELTRLYESALIFFLPSRAETLGYSILEAMAARCAIVSSVPLTFYGYKIQNKDKVEDIARKIKEMIESKKTRKLGEKNRRIVKNCTWRNFIATFNKLINSLTKK